MKSIGLFAAAAALSLIALSPASASDIMPRQRPAAASVYAPAVPAAYVSPVYDWTGFYLGASLGYGFGDATSGRTRIDTESFVGNIHAGYIKQFGQIVVGAEVAGYPLSGLRGSTASRCAPGVTCSVDVRTSWSVAPSAIVGIAMGPRNEWLPYLKGGYHWNQVKADFTAKAGGVTLASTKITAKQDGWHAGGGLQYRINERWSAQAEYLYAAGDVDRLNATTRSHLFLVGANYHF